MSPSSSTRGPIETASIALVPKAPFFCNSVGNVKVASIPADGGAQLRAEVRDDQRVAGIHLTLAARSL